MTQPKLKRSPTKRSPATMRPQAMLEWLTASTPLLEWSLRTRHQMIHPGSTFPAPPFFPFFSKKTNLKKKLNYYNQQVHTQLSLFPEKGQKCSLGSKIEMARNSSRRNEKKLGRNLTMRVKLSPRSRKGSPTTTKPPLTKLFAELTVPSLPPTGSTSTPSQTTSLIPSPAPTSTLTPRSSSLLPTASSTPNSTLSPSSKSSDTPFSTSGTTRAPARIILPRMH